MTDVQFGILLWSQAASWNEMLDAAKRVDRLGYAHLWTWDHLYAIFGDPYQDFFEGYSLLSSWARETEHARLGLLVGANTFRNPGIVAKSITTIDHASDGRAILGIGGAWMDLEHQQHGIDFGSGFGQRLDWLDESTAAMRALLDGETVTSPAGGHYAFDGLRHHPLPVQPISWACNSGKMPPPRQAALQLLQMNSASPQSTPPCTLASRPLKSSTPFT